MKSFRPAHSAQPSSSHDFVQHRQTAARAAFAVAMLWASGSAIAGKSLVQVSDGSNEYTGRIVALDRFKCTLMNRQGRLIELDVPKLRGVEQVADRFRPDSVSKFRSQLKQEFGRGYEVHGTTHYLVCARPGTAKPYADLFEDIYRDVEKFYRVQGFRVSTPDVPLVAVVFGTQDEFAAYCRKDNVPPHPGLQGYYSLVSNRVALFARNRSITTHTRRNPDGAIAALAGAGGQTASTIVHETIHQVSYNLGIHSRLGGTPLWVVEGLATSLEPAPMRSSRAVGQRVNSERFNWFTARYGPTRASGGLARLIASDNVFQQQTLNAYSEAWALTYFLLDNSTRRRNFIRYLQRVEMESGLSYTEKQRLEDFQAEFGDIARLEVDFLRFIERL